MLSGLCPDPYLDHAFTTTTKTITKCYVSYHVVVVVVVVAIVTVVT